MQARINAKVFPKYIATDEKRSRLADGNCGEGGIVAPLFIVNQHATWQALGRIRAITQSAEKGMIEQPLLTLEI